MKVFLSFVSRSDFKDVWLKWNQEQLKSWNSDAYFIKGEFKIAGRPRFPSARLVNCGRRDAPTSEAPSGFNRHPSDLKRKELFPSRVGVGHGN